MMLRPFSVALLALALCGTYGFAPGADAAEKSSPKPARENGKKPGAPKATASPAPEADPFLEALRSTYEHNPRILAQRKSVEAADELAVQAASGFRSTVNANYDYGTQRHSFDGHAEPGGLFAPTPNKRWEHSNGYKRRLSVEQPLFRGGSTFAQLNSARQRIKAARNQLNAVEQSVMLEAITSYMDVALAQHTLELARANEQTLARQLDGTQVRFRAGDVTRTDVAQSESRLANAKVTTVSAEGALASAQATFERIVGYKPDGLFPAPQGYPSVPATLEEALAVARAASPTLLAAIHTQKSAHYDVRDQMGALLPQVSLVGSMSRDDAAGTYGTNSFDTDSLTVNVRIPLYQAGAEYSRIREAKARERQRKDETRGSAATVEENTAKAWERLSTSRATMESREAQIKAAEEALSGVKTEQEYGARTILDVLDAEQELFQARTSFARAQRDYRVAIYGLLATTGQLTPENLQIGLNSYDPTIHYDNVKLLPIGF